MRILAYIDPGTGALVWQSIIGFFVGIFFYLRRTRKWIGGLMARALRPGGKAVDSSVDIQMNKPSIGADRS